MKIFTIGLVLLLNLEITSQVIKNYWYQQGPFGGEVSDISISSSNKIAVTANERTSVLNYEWVEVTNGVSLKDIEYFPGTSFLLTLKGNSIRKTSDNGYHWFNLFSSSDTLSGLNIMLSDTSKIIAWSDRNIYIIDFDHQEYDSIHTDFKINAVYSNPQNRLSFWTASDSGLFITNDFGKSFINSLPGQSTSSLTFLNNSSDKIFVVNNYNDSVYVSTDTGKTWHAQKISQSENLKVHQLTSHPTQPWIFAATSGGIYRSIDSGIHWNSISQNLTFQYFGKDSILAVKRIAVTESEIFAGTIEGLYRYAFNQNDWQQIGPLNETILSLGKNAVFYNENIFAGTPRGIKYFDYSEWKVSSLYSSSPLPINTILTGTVEDNNIALAATQKPGNIPVIYQSTDNGMNWFEVFIGDSGSGKINQFFQRKDSSNIIYALCENLDGKTALLKSTYNGNSGTWYSISSLNKSFNYAASKEYSDEIYLLVNRKELYILDSEDSLKYLTDIPGDHYNSIYFDHYGAYLYAAGSGIERTSNFSTWENFGLDTLEVIEVVEDYSSIFAATKNNGVLSSFYTSGQWSPFYFGMPVNIEITDIVNFSHGVLHVGTKNNSVFMQYTIINNVGNKEQQPAGFYLLQNYPNPFNPTTNFEFRIAEFGLVTLKVYDVLGNEVATLVNEQKQPGVYTIRFDGRNSASGVYFYELKAGNYSSVKKFMLLK